MERNGWAQRVAGMSNLEMVHLTAFTAVWQAQAAFMQMSVWNTDPDTSPCSTACAAAFHFSTYLHTG